MLRNMFGSAKARKDEQRKADIYRSILHHEARLGGQLFGPIPKGVRREFFCLDEHTWVWHEEWKDANGKYQTVTTRYDVRPSGIVKSQGNHAYQALSMEEAANLHRAIRLYGQTVRPELHRMAQQVA